MFSAMLNNIQDVRRFKARQKYARANQIEENVRSESLAFIKFFFQSCPISGQVPKMSSFARTGQVEPLNSPL